MNTTLRARAPVLSNSWMKKAASRWVIPIAPNTTENCSASPRTFACRAICAAISLAGRPAPEKIGSFWPRTSVFITSMVEMPVWMNSAGFARATGLIGAPRIGRRFSGMIGGRPSIGSPSPLNRRPIISRLTPILATSSRRLSEVLARSMPRVSSNTWITALRSETSMTCPPRMLPSCT